MGVLAVTVEARQRMSMGHDAGKAFHTQSHAHVPGSVLRGAIASAWLNRYGTTDATFRAVFDRDLRFGPLFADGTDLQPLSVRSCKYDPEHCGAQGYSTSYWDAAFPVPGGVRLPDDWLGGHWVAGRGEVVAAPGATLPMTDVYSTAIRHDTGTAAAGQLFSRGAVETGTVLRGHIVGGGETLAVVAKALHDLDRLELGGRSSVLGSARITVSDAADPEPPTGRRVVLRLLSPAFLVDAASRVSLQLDAELRRLKFGGIVESVWSRPLTDGTGGFHAASRLPKPVDIGLAAGTTAVLLPAEGDLERLAEMAHTGIGLRRPEGFGWVTFADTPWQTPHGTAPDVPIEDDRGFQVMRDQVRALKLPDEPARWLVARLTDVTDAPASLAAALAQPGASTLSEHQRDVVAAVLAEPAGIRRRLADALTDRMPR
jgi:CRISPR-associated protein Csx10